MRNLKKLLSLLLAVLMVISMAACAGSPAADTEPSGTETEQTAPSAENKDASIIIGVPSLGAEQLDYCCAAQDAERERSALKMLNVRHCKLNAGQTPKLCVLPGEGAAAECVLASMKVLEAMKLPIETDLLDVKTMRNEEMYRHMDESHAIWFGAMANGMNLLGYLRWTRGTYANVRPVQYHKNFNSPLKNPENIDFIVIRENLEDLYHEGSAAMAQCPGVEKLFGELRDTGREASPCVFVTDSENWNKTEQLHEEVFGPLGLVVLAKDEEELLTLARGFAGQLTCTMQLAKEDMALARKLTPILADKAGRVLVNGYPTGVEVCDSMVHGGPYPASINFGATSVGTMSIRRFLRPVCFQGFPEELLPDDLR